jgi:uncharacterized membrane protein
MVALELGKNRIEAFSDGVFAIVVTLLVLEIHLPPMNISDNPNALLEGLLAIAPHILSYMVSFIIVIIYWINHHHLFDILRGSNRGILWFNSLFLMIVSFIPFPTTLIGTYPHQKVAAIFYGCVMLIAAIAFSLLRWYATIRTDMVKKEIPKEFFVMAMKRSLRGPLMYSIATATAFVSTLTAEIFFILIPLLFVMPSISTVREAE